MLATVRLPDHIDAPELLAEAFAADEGESGDDRLDAARQRVEDAQAREAEALERRDSAKAAADVAKAAFDAKKVSKGDWLAARAAVKPFRAALKEAKSKAVLARKFLRQVEKESSAKIAAPGKAMEDLERAAFEPVQKLLGEAARDFELIAVSPFGVHLDLRPAFEAEDSEALGVPHIDPDETPEEAAAALEAAIEAAADRAALEVREMIESAARVAAYEERMREMAEDFAAHHAALHRMATCPDGRLMMEGVR